MKCELCNKRAEKVALVNLCIQHEREIDNLLEEVRLELLAEAELDQRNPAKVEAGGPNPPSETTLSFSGRTRGSEPRDEGSNPSGVT